MDKLQQFSDSIRAFEATFNCHTTLHDYTGDIFNTIDCIENLHINPYCSYFKEKAKQNDRCRYFDSTYAIQLLSKQCKPYFKYCHCQALELVQPVTVSNRLAGNLFIGPFHPDGPLPPDTVISHSVCPNITELVQKYPLPKLDQQNANRLLQMSFLIIHSLENLLEESATTLTATGSRKELIESFISTNFKDSNTSLSHLADFLCLSDSRTTQLVRDLFGQTYPQLLTEKRLQYTKKLLRKSYFSISQIAVMSGFSSPSYFFRIFKKSTGQTAKEYRNSNSEELSETDV